MGHPSIPLMTIMEQNQSEIRAAGARLGIAARSRRRAKRTVDVLLATVAIRGQLDELLSPVAQDPGRWLFDLSGVVRDTLLDRMYLQPLAELACEITAHRQATRTLRCRRPRTHAATARVERLLASIDQSLEILLEQERLLAGELEAAIDGYLADAIAREIAYPSSAESRAA